MSTNTGNMSVSSNSNTSVSTGVIQSNNTAAQPPQPMDIDEGVEEFPWTGNQQKVIDDYVQYLDDERARVEQFRIDPFVDGVWPKRPTHPKSLLPGGSNKRLLGEELNSYLKENCVIPVDLDWPSEPQNGFLNLEKNPGMLTTGMASNKTAAT